MSSGQRQRMAPPSTSDKDTLKDYTAVLQGNLKDLFELSHTHAPLSAAPSTSDGIVGDIRIVAISGTYYLYAKVATATWKRVVLG